MSVKLRLQRHGAKKRPFYRIVAADSRARRDGRFLEVVGTYNPTTHPIELRLNNERVEHWLGVGAQPSDTVASLLRRAKRDPDMLAPRKPARKAAPVPKAEETKPKKAAAKKTEAPKAEAKKAEAPKAEVKKAEAPKAEAPKAEVEKTEAPKAEAPKAEAPKAEEPKAEEPKAE